LPTRPPAKPTTPEQIARPETCDVADPFLIRLGYASLSEQDEFFADAVLARRCRTAWAPTNGDIFARVLRERQEDDRQVAPLRAAD
jgi:hypothetical protein